MLPGRPARVPAAGPVAVCTLTDRELAAELRDCRGVGLAGPLMTANLGIEQVIWAVLDRPWICCLVICGRDSPLFRAGQSLVALLRDGISGPDRRIVGALGYMPFLRSITPAQVIAFRRQVELADSRGESNPDRLRAHIGVLASSCRPRAGPGAGPAGGAGDASGQGPGGGVNAVIAPSQRGHEFITLRPGGRREPVARSGGGFFVISIDRPAGQVIVHHYWPDLRPGHRMRGVRAESMLLGLIGAGLLDCASHAGYLGAELAKAEAALRLGLDYEQDKPLRRVLQGALPPCSG